MEERIKILQMLQDGIINVDEANDLLKTIDNQKVEVELDGKTKIFTKKEYLKNTNQKMLIVKVISGDGDKVNLNLPISFLKAAIAAGNLESIYSKSIKINGIEKDFIKNNLDIDLLIDYIENDYSGVLLDLTSADGDVVKISIE